MAVKVLIVDDSSLIRQIFTDLLESEPGITVVGTANDGDEALQKIVSLKPDVVTLDIEMPKMNGLECLAKIMKVTPLPVIILSYLAVKGADVTFKALELGAIDFVTKPSKEADSDSLSLIKQELIQKIKIAAGIQTFKLKNLISPSDLPQVNQEKITISVDKKLQYDLITIGASTGGPKALYDLLTQFPKNFPMGIIIAQHMPKGFTSVFAKRLHSFCNMEVLEAKTGDEIKPGKVLIAPSGYQTKVLRSKKGLVVEVTEEPKLILKPSVDFLFDSIAECCQSKVISIILTGMGSDGAVGMKKLRDLGARTIAQSEKSCIIYGMPRVAVEMGGVEFIEDLSDIFPRIISVINE